MKLKRNLLSILYTVLFLFVTGFGLFQMTNLIVSTVPHKYLVTSIIIFGLIIYLIVAFFIKEADTLRFIQTKRAVMILLECMVVLLCGGLFFYTQWIGQGMAPAVIYTLLLLSMYATARFCGGRLCGILCAVITFYMFSTLSTTDLISTQSAIDMLCFLLPFFIFLGIMRILVPKLGNNGFVLMVAYLVLGFVFSLALAVNPFVCILLIGCVLSLLFTSPRQKEQSIWAKGIFSAALLVVFTIGFVVCIRFMIPDILGMPNWKLDRSFPLAFELDTLTYIVNKYANPVTYLYLHFFYGILPALLFFFSFIAGYYAIRKKSSYISPLILSQVALFAYYIVFCEGGSQFYYLYYMLPIFAAYGFSNTLLSDEPVAQEELPAEDLVGEPTSDVPTPEPAPEEVMLQAEPEPPVEAAPAAQTELLEEPETTLAPEMMPAPESTTIQEPETIPEAALILEAVPDTAAIPDSENKKEKKKKEKKKKEKKQNKKEKKIPEAELPTAPVPSAPTNGEIPEWTIPAEFLPENQDLQSFEPKEETSEQEVSEVVLEEESPVVPDVDDSINLDEFVADESVLVPEEAAVLAPEEADVLVPEEVDVLVPEEATVSEPEPVQTDDTENILVGQEELSTDNILQVDEPDQVDTIAHNGSNDIEQFLSTGATDSNDSVLEFSEDVSEVGQLQENASDEDVLMDEKAEETQLNNLLDRLDMSEPIKRMNESAKEDIADVIEREEEQVELSEALPLNPSKSALPKYKKPDFDFEMEPVSIPLDDQFSTISEYDEVPTVHDLENQWKNNSKPVIETVATKVEEQQAEERQAEEPTPAMEKKEEPELVHSEQIVRKNGMGKRSYHKITIR